MRHAFANAVRRAAAAAFLCLLGPLPAPVMAQRPATAFDPYAGPMPLAVFVETEPQLLVAGSDMPRVAVYETGEVVFARVSGGSISYRRAVLDKTGMAELAGRTRAVLRRKDSRPLYDLLPGASGVSETRFYLREAGRENAIAVRGWDTNASTAIIPAELARLRDWFLGFDAPEATAWKPKYIEVMFWPNPEATDESIAWPPEWPSPQSSRAIARGQMISIYLDGSALPVLRDFLYTQKPKGAVLVGGRKMAVDFRFVFPSEPMWRNAFAARARAVVGGNALD